jgi:iron-sulfur cluster repair protein YtfE (RIC family)
MATAIAQIQPARADEAQPAPARVDLYSGIHKAIRMMMSDLLVALGRMDGADAEERGATLARLRHFLDLARHHLHKEDQYVHPAMESRRRGSTSLMRKQHAEHEDAFERLEALALRVEASPAAGRAAAALDLYRGFALYMADDLVHMHEEETENNAVLWAHFSDAELLGIHQAIVAAVGPVLPEFMRWLVPAMTPAERADLLSGMRAAMPAEVFSGIAALARSVLGEREWSKLLAALGPRPLAV